MVLWATLSCPTNFWFLLFIVHSTYIPNALQLPPSSPVSLWSISGSWRTWLNSVFPSKPHFAGASSPVSFSPTILHLRCISSRTLTPLTPFQPLSHIAWRSPSWKWKPCFEKCNITPSLVIQPYGVTEVFNIQLLRVANMVFALHDGRISICLILISRCWWYSVYYLDIPGTSHASNSALSYVLTPPTLPLVSLPFGEDIDILAKHSCSSNVTILPVSQQP